MKNIALEEAIIEHIADGIIVFDPQLNVNFSNPAGEKNLKSDEKLIKNFISNTYRKKTAYKNTRNYIFHSYKLDKENILLVIHTKNDIAKSKTDFISVAAHEIKTPISVINAYSQMLVKQLKGDKEEKYAQKIYEKTLVLTDYVNSIFDEIKLSSGKFHYDDKKRSINKIVKSSVEEQQKLFPNRKIILQGKSKHNVKVDDKRINQVLANFIKNALTHSGSSDEVIIKVEDKNDCTRVSVVDNGNGIDKKDIKKVFTPFYRSENAVRNKVEGLGLGLYICKQIIDHYNGDIGVKSKVGEGTTFYFDLPVN